MNHASKSLPKDVKSLTNLVLELRDQINDLHSEVTTKNAKIDHQSNYIDQLVEAIALAKQQYFGSRSLKVDTSSSQLSWLFKEAEVIADHESNQDDDEPGTGKKQTTPRKRRSGVANPCRITFQLLRLFTTSMRRIVIAITAKVSLKKWATRLASRLN